MGYYCVGCCYKDVVWATTVWATAWHYKDTVEQVMWATAVWAAATKIQ